MESHAQQVIPEGIEPEEATLAGEDEARQRADRRGAVGEGGHRAAEGAGAEDGAEVVELKDAGEGARPDRRAGGEQRRGFETLGSSRAHGREDTPGGPARAPRRGLLVWLAAASLALLVATPALAQNPGGNCSCDELRDYLKTVEQKEDCYKKAFVAGRKTPFKSQAAVRSFMETCMGWDVGSAVSEGKPETATEEEKKQADDACKAAHCEWICRVSVRGVHEQYHVWYDKNERMWAVTLVFRYGVWGKGTEAMQQENIVGEIGAHDAEAQFLRDRIAEAEKKGDCSNVRQTIDPAERDKRIREAHERVKKYLDSLGGKP